MKVSAKENDILITEVNEFSLLETLDCGQAFRWREEKPNLWVGVAFSKVLKIEQTENGITLYNTSLEDFNNIWREYFDLDRDYRIIINEISKNEVFKKASSFASGIRLLRQGPFEALCSFIISQNNNIPRIKGIVERFCQNFGTEIAPDFYSFPTAEKVASLSLDDLAVIRSGFRAKYILDAAKKVSSGEIDLTALKSANIDEARQELMKIYGVGEKVADCTLLFGLNRIEAFPKDVWIKRATQKLFDGKLPECALPYAGIAQQYLFHYARMTKLDI